MTSAPLAGRRVVVTRPRSQAAGLVAALETAGATAIAVPVIEIVDPADGGVSLRAGLAALRADDWLVLTSPNGAARVGAALSNRSLPDGVKVAVIGPGTRSQAEAVGLTVDLVPQSAIAEGLVAKFPTLPATGGRVLLARAEVARETLPIELRMMGWTVDEVVAYRTITVSVSAEDAEACRSAAIVAFTSATTVTGLVDAVGVDGLPEVVASIGPATSARASALNVKVDIEAPIHTIAGLVEAIVANLAP